MDHTYITDHAIVERYVMGLLHPEESSTFEEHFRSCAKCLFSVEAIQDFHVGAKDSAPAVALPTPAYRPPVPESPPSPALINGWAHFAMRPLVWGLAGLLFAGIPGIWVFREMRSAKAQVRRASTDFANLRLGFEQNRQDLIGLRREMTSNAAPPATSIPVFGIGMSRSGAGVAPANLIDATGAASQWLVLALDYPPDPAVKRYRARIVDGTGGLVTTVDPVTPVKAGSLAIAIRSGVLKPGKYRATLEGVTESGSAAVIARYAFAVR